MAFSTASNISSVDAFITALIAFAVVNAGFTDDGTDTGGTETLYRFSKTVDSVKTWYGLRKETSAQTIYADEIVAGRMMLELPTDSNFSTLDKGQRFTTNLGMFDIAAPFTGYSFFTDGVSVFAVLEVTSGVFAHMAFGNITKVGVWAGGAYLMANNFQVISGVGTWRPLVDVSHNSSSMVFGARVNLGTQNAGAGYIRFNTGGADNSDFTKLGGSDNAGDGALLGATGTMPPHYQSSRYLSTGTQYSLDMNNSMVQASPSEVTFISPLLPIRMFRQHSTGSIVRSVPLGHIPNIACINLRQLSDKDLVNTDWRVFPISSQTEEVSVATFSDFYGIAYKEIT